MEKIKKLGLLMLVIALISVLSACTGDDEVAPVDTNGQEEEEVVEIEAPAPIEEQAGLYWMPSARIEGPAPPEPVNAGVIVIGVDGAFQERWNPFMAESVYDNQVMRQVFGSLLTRDESGALVPHLAESVEYEVIDGNTLYTITLREGLVFSDGSPITIDDWIYSLYVRADPSFTGPSSLIAGENLIFGVREYFYDDPNYSVRLAEIEASAARFATDVITLEDFRYYALETDVGGWMDFGPVGWMEDEWDDERLDELDPDDEDAVKELFIEFVYTFYLDFHDVYNWYKEPQILQMAMDNLEDGVTVPEIEGITRIDDLTATVKMEGIHFDGLAGLASFNGQGPIVSRYFFGPFEKGDVTPVTGNFNPTVGSGPFVWTGFANNIATVVSNPLYVQGVPATGTIRWQYVPSEDIVTALISGQIDIANPVASIPNLEDLRAADNVEYSLLDNAGYLYVGFNHNNVEHDVRRGFAHLMNRAPSVEAFFGDLAVIIERPMTTILAEYPHDAEEVYGYDVEAALEFFLAAGYSQVNGQLVDENGNPFSYNIFIAGGGVGDHPVSPMVTQAQVDVASLGGELIIQDVPFNVLQAAMDDGTADMFVLAWADVFNADKTAQFHTTGGQNRFNVSSPRMDALLEQINEALDLTERTALVAEMLDYAMYLVIEFPVYQRQNLLAFYTRFLDTSTLPAHSTPFFNYENVLWQLATTQ